jgi:hypothetical protein
MLNHNILLFEFQLVQKHNISPFGDWKKTFRFEISICRPMHQMMQQCIQKLQGDKQY